MKNKKNFSKNKRFIDYLNLLLFLVIFFTLNIIHQSVKAYPYTKKEAAAEYKNCERKKDLTEKIYCMESLRKSLGDYGSRSYSGYLSDKSNRELKAIYRKERNRAQVKIANLPNDD